MAKTWIKVEFWAEGDPVEVERRRCDDPLGLAGDLGLGTVFDAIDGLTLKPLVVSIGEQTYDIDER